MLSAAIAAAQGQGEYSAVQTRLARGWNTWDVHSVATQVLLPEGLALRVGFKHVTQLVSEAFLSDALIGRQEKNTEQVFPGPHAYDGSYTDLRIAWRGHNIRIQSAHVDDDLVLLVSPLPGEKTSERSSGLAPAIVISAGILWNREGSVSKNGNHLEARAGSRGIPIYFTGKDEFWTAVPVNGPYFEARFSEPMGVSTGRQRTLSEITAGIEKQRFAYEASNVRAGQQVPIADAIQTVIGWDTIFEPEKQRILSPVSRIWSLNWGGYVVFDWDTFFAASLAAVGSRDLAYANVIEVLREATPEGFVPNFARAGGWKSVDRSEPPVGAITVLDLYRKFRDAWLLRETFEPLLRWNRWWARHRDLQGYLVWGSDQENQPRIVDDSSVGTLQGAKFESGLDNSPMYDEATFVPETHLMQFADVGLMGMYVADCKALAEIADVLGRRTEAAELRARAGKYTASLQTLWDEKTGMYLNKDLKTGAFSYRLSPTNFYPMLASIPTAQQATRMVREHLTNPAEFWGPWVIPSIARNDPAFKDQNYWRGRVWGPMNYLVYLGLLNYEFPEVRKDLARKSLELFLKEWQANGHVHENYNAVTGAGDDVSSSDRFYHWGALLGLIDYRERVESAAAVH